MNRIANIGTASDRVVEQLIAGLEIEFGSGFGAVAAHHFLEAEEAELHWEAHVAERWMGSYENLEGDELELDRVEILGRLNGG